MAIVGSANKEIAEIIAWDHENRKLLSNGILHPFGKISDGIKRKLIIINFKWVFSG
jgi:hypothetical protein